MIRKFAILAAATLVSSLAFGQDPNLVLRVSNAAGLDGTTIFTNVGFDNTGPSFVDGWSYGVCHDTAVLTIRSRPRITSTSCRRFGSDSADPESSKPEA
ncbi:MAG: hypothetical protein AB7O52_00580 [Planctomycetota bacterium]